MSERRQFGHFRNKTYIKSRYPRRDQRDPVKELEFFRGDTIRFEVQVFDEDDNTVDLTGYTITTTARCEEWSPDILFQATLNDVDAVKILNAPEGVLQITFPIELTRMLEPRSYFFDVELVRESDGFVQTVLREVFSIIRDITTS